MIVVRRRHDLGLAKAKRLAERMAQHLQADYGGSYAWDGDELSFRRTGASGSVAVTKNDVEIRLELGFLLRPLGSRIEREIQAFCDDQFGKDGASADRSRAGRPRAGKRSGRRP
jgi:putative polyhydroxyalkanoate system protein